MELALWFQPARMAPLSLGLYLPGSSSKFCFFPNLQNCRKCKRKKILMNRINVATPQFFPSEMIFQMPILTLTRRAGHPSYSPSLRAVSEDAAECRHRFAAWNNLTLWFSLCVFCRLYPSSGSQGPWGVSSETLCAMQL